MGGCRVYSLTAVYEKEVTAREHTDDAAQPRGTVQEQLVRRYSYLFQMAQQLNVALGQLESGRTAAPSARHCGPGGRQGSSIQTPEEV